MQRVTMQCKLWTWAVSFVAFVVVPACQGYRLHDLYQKSQLAKHAAPRTSEEGKPWPGGQLKKTSVWRRPAKVGEEARRVPGRTPSFYVDDKDWEGVDLYVPQVYYGDAGELPQYSGKPIGFVQHNSGSKQKDNSRRTKTRLIEAKLYNELNSRHKRDANLTISREGTITTTMSTPTNKAPAKTRLPGSTEKATDGTGIKRKLKLNGTEKAGIMPKNVAISSAKNPNIKIKKTTTSVNLPSVEGEVEVIMTTATNRGEKNPRSSIGKTKKVRNETSITTKSKSSAIEKIGNAPKKVAISSAKNHPNIKKKKTSTKSKVAITAKDHPNIKTKKISTKSVTQPSAEEVEGINSTATNKPEKNMTSSTGKTENATNGTRMKTKSKSDVIQKNKNTPKRSTITTVKKTKIKTKKTPTESVSLPSVNEEVESSKKPKLKRIMKLADIDTPAKKTKKAKKVKTLAHTNANLSLENASTKAAVMSTKTRKPKLTKLVKSVPKISTSLEGDKKTVVLSKTRKKKITKTVKQQKLDEPTSETAPIIMKGVTGRDGVQIVSTGDMGMDKTLNVTQVDNRVQIGHMESALAEQERIIAKLEQEGKLIDTVRDPKLPGWQDVVNNTVPSRKESHLAKNAKKKERYAARPKAASKLDFDVPNKWILEGKEKPPQIMHDLDDDITDYVDDSEGDWAKSRITNWTEATNSTRKTGGIHEKQAVPGKRIDPRDKGTKRSDRRQSDYLHDTKPKDRSPPGGSGDSRRNKMTGSITRVLKPGDNYIELPKSEEEPDRGPYAYPRSDQKLWDDPKRKYQGEQRSSDRESVRREQRPNDRGSFRRDQRPNDRGSFRGDQRPNDRRSFRGDQRPNDRGSFRGDQRQNDRESFRGARGSGGFQRRYDDRRSYPRRDDERSGNSGYSSRRDERPNFRPRDRDDRTNSQNAYGRGRWQSGDRRNRETDYRTRESNWRDSRGSTGFRGSDRRELQDSRRRDGRNRNDDRYLKNDPNRLQNRNLYRDRNQKTDSGSEGPKENSNKISVKDNDDSPRPPMDEPEKKKTKKKRSAKCKRNRINFIKKMKNQ